MRLVFCFLSLILGCWARYAIKPLGYLKLPTSIQPAVEYKMFGGTAEEAAYDPRSQIIYVVGEESRLLHVVDVSDPSNPQRLLSREFAQGDGNPRDVAFCGGQVAIALSSDVTVFAGHVQFFNAYDRLTNTLQYDRRVTVGEFPDMLMYTPDCVNLLVANEGRSGLDHTGRYVDPEGSITIIVKGSSGGNPSEKFVDFNTFNSRRDIRLPAKSISPNILHIRSTAAQELEPEYIALVDSTYAYVSFQENSAIGRIQIRSAVADTLTPLPDKDLTEVGMDASDRDGGIHLLRYPIKGIRQPDVIKALKVGNKKYLFTVDEGSLSRFTKTDHGFTWSEGMRADDMSRNQRFDAIGINNATLLQQLSRDSKLGRLHISNIDGLNPFTGKVDTVRSFGGRGFSIWDGTKYTLLYDSGNDLERRAKDSYYNIFNTDCLNEKTSSPETLRDSVSDDMGPKPNGMDVKEDDGEIFVVVGSETTGIIYLYNVTFLANGPVVDFQDIYRRGSTNFLWQELYDTDDAGDAYIADITIIPSADSPTNKTLFYVVGSATGSVSLYEIEDLGPDLPPLNPAVG